MQLSFISDKSCSNCSCETMLVGKTPGAAAESRALCLILKDGRDFNFGKMGDPDRKVVTTHFVFTAFLQPTVSWGIPLGF
jgi:hypothetical protein